MDFCNILVILGFLSVSLGLPSEKILPVEPIAEKKLSEPSGKLNVPQTSLREKLKTYFPVEPSELLTSREDQGGATRSARESPLIYSRGPHSTKVCIYVSSDHQGPVICGPEVNDKKEGPPNAAARFALPNDFYQRTSSLGPSYPFAPSRYPQRFQPLSPHPAARGPFPGKRSEDSQPDPSEQAYYPASPASGPSPTQQQQLPISPVSPPPQKMIPPSHAGTPGVVVHRQYYQPQPIYPSSLNLHSPLASLMRLNCAVEPEGGHYLPAPAPAPALRYFPIGEQLISLPDGTTAKFGANLVDPPQLRTQNPFSLPQDRRKFKDAQKNSTISDLAESSFFDAILDPSKFFIGNPIYSLPSHPNSDVRHLTLLRPGREVLLGSPAEYMFPNHRYFGIGNPMSNGEPVDEDDRIAQLHDQDYVDARGDSDIHEADRRALGRFESDFMSTGNWHSAAAALGLGAKYLAESLVGVLYRG